MTPNVIILDTSVLGQVTQQPGKTSSVDACLQWIAAMTISGRRIVVPEITDYEVRRELIRAKKLPGLARLDAFNAARIDRYLALTTDAMRRAADLWARVRNAGLPTTDLHSLDADVILAAQALTMGVPPADLIVATQNVRHITRFVAADVWQNIQP